MLLEKLKFSLSLFALSALVLTSCSEDDPINEAPVVTTGAYLLNSGSQGNNDTSLSYYDFTTQNVNKDVYRTLNGTLMGDTGNDMIIYGSKMYFAVTVSGKIIVTDNNGLLIKNITSEQNNALQEPRNLTTYEGKLYVTYKNGYLARIDTTTLSIENQVKVGRNPEQVAVANRKLYVANSGGFGFETSEGYDKTVSVVSVDNFTVLKTLEVVPNPAKILADNQGDLYVISHNSYNNDGALQRIDSKTDVVSKIDGFTSPASMAFMKNSTLYVIQVRYEGYVPVPTYSVFDTSTEKITSNQFITDGTTLTAPGFINVEPVTGNVYIGDSPTYTGNGDIYIFSPQGKLLKKFDSGGAGPIQACFINK